MRIRINNPTSRTQDAVFQIARIHRALSVHYSAVQNNFTRPTLSGAPPHARRHSRTKHTGCGEPLRRPESEFGLPNSAGPNCVEQWRGNSEPPAGMASLLFWPQGYAHKRSYRGITIAILADRGYGCWPARFSAHGAGGGPPSGKDS